MRFLLAFLLSFSCASAYEVKSVTILEINSSINPATLNYIKQGLKKANAQNEGMLLIKMNTPGGLVTTTKDILTSFGTSKAPVVVWVTPEGASATSAGAIISAGAHFLYMSPGTNIGAATPVGLGGGKDEKGQSKDMRAKAVNDLVALVKSLSNARGRNGEEFAKMISQAKSLPAKEAKKKNVINDLANSYEQVLDKIQGQQIIILGEKTKISLSKHPVKNIVDMDLGQWLLNIFANPSLAYICFIIAAALIYFELQAPGGFIAGGLGVVFLILAGIGFQVLPLNFGALGLIIAGFVLFILEAFVTSYGILSIAGLAAVFFGSSFLFRSEHGHVELKSSLIYSTVFGVGLFMAFVVFYWLNDATKNKEGSDFNNFVGREGQIVGLVEEHNGQYTYQIKVTGEIWKATSKNKYNEGDFVKILGQDQAKMFLSI